MNGQDNSLALSLILNYLSPEKLTALLSVDQFSQAILSLKPTLYWKNQFEMLSGRQVDFNSEIDWKVACDLLKEGGLLLSGEVKYVKLGLVIGLDPSSKDNYAIKWASANCHFEVMKLLLEDSRVRGSLRR